MKKSKLISIVLCIAVILSCFSYTAMAAGFDDVDKDPTISWAKDSIDKMTQAGYIKGYEDGTFRPFKAISNIECLILMSRMIGFEDDEYSETVAAAADMFKSVASKYNTTYAKELSYLLYCGILEEGDLASYASSANANVSLQRYQAAILMSKLMGKNNTAKAYKVTTPTYADDSYIPAKAKPYVEYVTANKIMNGMDATASGEPQFSPSTSLTRAQMATLLARMMDTLSLGLVDGKIEDVSDNSITVDGEELELLDSAKIYKDGKKCDLDDINVDDTAYIISICDGALVIEAFEPQVATTVYGVVVRKSETSDGKKITIADYEDKDITATYTLKDDCTIKVDGTKGMFGDIMADDFVKLELIGSKVSAISTEDTRFDITGTLVSVDYDDADHVYITAADKNGVENVYTVSIKGVKVSRDGDTVEFRELSKGDDVTLRLTYGKVTVVTATSHSETISGSLTEIIISSSPAITVSANGTSETYKLRPDAKITVAGKQADIYALRPNISITAKLESSEIKSINAASVAVSEKGEMNGVVTGKNSTYSVINIEDNDGNIQNVYYNTKTTFLNSNGQSTTIKAIEKGATISVTGAEANGIFEATIIIVK